MLSLTPTVWTARGWKSYLSRTANPVWAATQHTLVSDSSKNACWLALSHFYRSPSQIRVPQGFLVLGHLFLSCVYLQKSSSSSVPVSPLCWCSAVLLTGRSEHPSSLLPLFSYQLGGSGEIPWGHLQGSQAPLTQSRLWPRVNRERTFVEWTERRQKGERPFVVPLKRVLVIPLSHPSRLRRLVQWLPLLSKMLKLWQFPPNFISTGYSFTFT